MCENTHNTANAMSSCIVYACLSCKSEKIDGTFAIVLHCHF